MKVLSEWNFDPDQMNFSHQGLKCQIKKQKESYYVAYILLPEGHPYFGVDEINLNLKLKPNSEITYTDFKGSFWAVGIDFAHFSDYVPGIDEELAPEGFEDIYEFFGFKKPTAEDYKNIEYAIKKVQDLAERLSISFH